MKSIIFKSILSLLLISLSINIASCKKNTTKSESVNEEWEVTITFNITEPATYSFQEFGDLDVEIDGEDVTITGTYTIGNLTYENIVFYGTLVDDEFTLLTNSYEVQFEFDGVVYTEVLTFDVDEFNNTNDSASASGTIVVVKNPGNTVESGTFTLIANKK